MNTGTVLDAAAAGDPARVAVIVDGRSISYGELMTEVRQCAGGSYMFEALKYRDQWESRLLRTSDWSPLH
jgi:hypothetical protein